MTSELRELTPAERGDLDRRQRRRRTGATVVAVVFVGWSVWPVREALRSVPAGSDDFWLALGIAVAGAAVIAGLYYLVALRRPVWRLRDGGYARVGRIRGRYRLRGKERTQYVGDFKVEGAERLGLSKGQDVEVEVCPALEDYTGWAPRVVVGVAGGPGARAR